MTKPFRNIPVLDCHIHYGRPELLPSMIEVLDNNHLSMCNIVCTPDSERLSLVPDALHLKAHAPERIFVFGGLDFSAYFLYPQSCGEKLAAYLDTMLAMGCDGIKMIEGKPDSRRNAGVPPFDSPVYAPYWAKVEQLGLPIVFHVNDPEEFWDDAQVPAWAKNEGWFWGDGTYINNEVQYSEVQNVLRRHPGIKVIFAHFFFFSKQLDRLGAWLDEFPNMHVDLTPGIEMFENFSIDPEKTREFFLKYQDRILFGTDIGAMSLDPNSGYIMDALDSRLRVETVRAFLEGEGDLDVETEKVVLFGKFHGTFRGIHLPDDALAKIYYQNFERLAGKKPRALNPAAIREECRRLVDLIPKAAASRGVTGDTSVAEKVLAYFSK
jgi:predicted TIM-barrel fold metal-dependent hydrolase